MVYFSLVESELNRTEIVRLAISGKPLTEAEDGFRSVADIAWAKMVEQGIGGGIAKQDANIDSRSPEGMKHSKQNA